MKPIPVVIVTRNGLALTKKTLASVMAQDVAVEVLIVENNSSDSTAQYLATKNISVIHAPEQWALAKCWNVALRALWKLGYDRALVLNNDLEIRKDCVSVINDYMRDWPLRPFVSCVSVDNPEQLGEAGDRNASALKSGEREHPDFSAFMIRKSVTDKIGFFNEEYFPAYSEDAEFHIRMFRAGIKAVCIDVPFLHHGASTLKQSDPGEAARIRRGADANRQRFKKVYGCLPGSSEYYALFGSTEPAPHAM